MTPPLSPISQWQWQWWWWSLAELGKNNIYGSRTVMRGQGNIFEGCKWTRERKRDVPPARECKYKTSEEERGVNIEASKYRPSQIQAIRNLFASAKHKGYGSRIWIALNLQLQKALPFAYCDHHHSIATNTRIVFCCPHSVLHPSCRVMDRRRRRVRIISLPTIYWCSQIDIIYLGTHSEQPRT